jgi:dTDP-glucose 4,6-dehydratase
MRLLVTGGAGFIGSTFVRRALSERPAPLPDVHVTVLDKLTYAGVEANLAPVAAHPGYTLVVGDIGDPDVVDGVMAGQDAVLNFAAESHVDRSLTDAAPFVATNVSGTQVLLESARRHRVGRFVQVSTDEVYGSIDTGSWTETQPLSPTSPYAASKAAADLLALAYHRTYGMDVVVTRGSNTYGPHQYPEKIIPLFVTNLLDGHPVPLYGAGDNVRDWLHASDHCRGIEQVLLSGRPGEIYHLAGGHELTNRRLTGLLLTALGAGRDRVTPVPDRAGHDHRYSLDTTKIRTELGWSPRIPFEHGLAETVRWYQEHRRWWEPLKARA